MLEQKTKKSPFEKTKNPLAVFCAGSIGDPSWHPGVEIQNWLVIRGHTVTYNPSKADIIVFAGGPDISPSLYNQPKHYATRAYSPERDFYEKNLAVLGKDTFKLGICRGAQLLNVLSGGTMIQNIGNKRHLSPHAVRLIKEPQVFERVTSTHHQMMVPSHKVSNREILAVTFNKTTGKDTLSASPHEKELPLPMARNRLEFFAKRKMSDFDLMRQDAEIIYCNNTRSLCIQAHPERMLGSSFERYCFSLVEKYAATK